MPTGQCNCGSVKVDIPDMPDSSVLCHCLSCRASGGTAFSTNLVVKKEDLTIYGEEHTKVYRDHKTDSGNVAARRFCANCGR
ncbi:Mss4-like protein [Rhodotorula diobovata]|uniref:Mss4-like protein n=1 Tax=Rhodotorula diobovata TaxID=5288 RepID=A0A5C5G364_9BASI|nr:Mss4-like protein [Rhodotorula diobovata]